MWRACRALLRHHGPEAGAFFVVALVAEREFFFREPGPGVQHFVITIRAGA